MEKYSCSYLSLWFIIFSIFFASSTTFTCHAFDQERQVYIVYMGSLPEEDYSPSSHHFSMLREVVDDISFVNKSFVRSYSRSFNAFAAYLTPQERDKLASLDGVVSVFPSLKFQPQTTRSWDFMGFPETAPRNPTAESDVIIGIIDTGVWPESESFRDHGIGPVPKKWKGACKGGQGFGIQNFTCNNKIIGARWYNQFSANNDYSAIDAWDGHGTHMASVAAGRSVKGANFFGLAQGTARGGVPSARIAVYKVCYVDEGCDLVDMLGAFDDVIADGVDIISLSLYGGSRELTVDPTSIVSFHAMEKGILTVNSAANFNPNDFGSVVGIAPWMVTVASSSIDRRIINKVVLGNGVTLIGNAVNTFDLNGTDFQLVSGKDVGKSSCDELSRRQCKSDCLEDDNKFVHGKILVCEDLWSWSNAYKAGAVGVVVPTDYEFDASMLLSLPASVLSTKDFDSVYAYMNSTRMPRANILKSEVVSNFDAPMVENSSARGPNVITPDIIKPDLTAPGVNILAAYSPNAPPCDDDDAPDHRSVKYSLASGTSVSAPHVAGAAAYVKSVHPDWSPSAIKSALMTTAWKMNATKNLGAEFAYGSGHIDPIKAINPGLLYETTREDYVKMLCSMSYGVQNLKQIFGGNISCPAGEEVAPKDLNYPSMAFKVNSKTNSSFAVKFSRTVTNVGQPNSTYTASITGDAHLHVAVEPSTLSFKSLGEKLPFVVTVTGELKVTSNMTMESASLEWSDGSHTVRSPIVVYDFITQIPHRHF